MNKFNQMLLNNILIP